MGCGVPGGWEELSCGVALALWPCASQPCAVPLCAVWPWPFGPVHHSPVQCPCAVPLCAVWPSVQCGLAMTTRVSSILEALGTSARHAWGFSTPLCAADWKLATLYLLLLALAVVQVAPGELPPALQPLRPPAPRNKMARRARAAPRSPLA